MCRFLHEAGALLATLDGLDVLVFTAVVGEHNATIRARMCASLEYLGIELDAVISSPTSRVTVVVEPSNEERGCALDAWHITQVGI
jgi:acetate kinase